MFRAFLLVAWAGLAATAAPIPGSFHQIDCDGGGWTTGFAVHPGGRVFARTDVGGLYRSDNHGTNWTFLSGDLPTAATLYVQGVAVSPVDSNLVYQCVGTSYASGDSGRGIWKSTDGGATWTQSKAGLNFSGNDEARWGGECVAIHPANPLAEVWVGTRRQGLWRTMDNAFSWTEVAPAVFSNVVITTVNLHPLFPDQVWVGGEGAAWVSVNRGATWTPVVAMERVWRIERKADGTVFIAGGNANPSSPTHTRLWRINGTNFADPAAYTPADVWPAWLDAFQAARGWRPAEYNPQLTVLSNGALVAGCLYQGNAISLNDGLTWQLLPMALTGAQPGWQLDPVPGQVPGGRNALAQDPVVANRWYLAGGYGPLRSGDAGTSWQYITQGIGQTVAWQVRFHPTDPLRAYLPLADHGLAVVSDAGDSGNTSGYIAKHFPWPDDNVVFSHRPLVSGNRLLAPGGEQGGNTPRIYLSTDHGLNWSKRVFSGLPTGGGRALVDALAASDAPDEFLVAVGGVSGTGAGGVYRTTDAGVSFTQATGLPAGFDYGDLFWWHPSLATDATDAARRYLLLRGNGFFRSVNRGAAWSKPAAQPRDNYGRVAADAVRGGRLWCAITSGLDRSTNGGDSWSPVSGFTTAEAVDAVDGRVAVIGRRTGDTATQIYYSGDDGATWNEISRPGWRFANATAVAVDPWRPGRVWISTSGRSVARFTPWTPLQSWRQTHFGSPDNAGAGRNDGDAEPDGQRNLAEYALGLDPQGADPAPLGRVGLAWPVLDGAPRAVVDLPRLLRRADVSLGLEMSTNLVAWVAAPEAAVLTDTANLLRLRIPDAWALHPLLYARIRFTAPPE